MTNGTISTRVAPFGDLFEISWKILIYYIPNNALLKIQAVPSSGIQTSRTHFPYHHSVIFRFRIMPVSCVNFNDMPKICQTTFCTKEDGCRPFDM